MIISKSCWLLINGMIVGITNNVNTLLNEKCAEPNRAIPMVQWQSGRHFSVHHNNLDLYKD